MPPIVIDVRNADDLRDVVHRAVEALAAGKIVAFPTETVYGLAASALCESAVLRLREIKGRAAHQPFALGIKSLDDAMDYVPDLNPLGRRIARRCWPGPITLVLKNGHTDSLIQQLPISAQEAFVPHGYLGIRVPAHDLLQQVLQILVGPVALTSANRHGAQDALTAKEVLESMDDDVDMVLDDGRSRLGQPSTVVRVDGDKYEILREGVVPQRTLKRLASMHILFVCTGNTCRSPLAEVIAKQMISQRRGCSVEDLEENGVIVMSAGIAAMMGSKPSADAVVTAKDLGLDLSQHAAQPLTATLVRHADQIFTMTNGHREAILAQWPEAHDRIQLLLPDSRDVADPIGQPQECYKECAEQIRGALKTRIDEMFT